MERIKLPGLDSEGIIAVTLWAAVGTTSIDGVTTNTEDTPKRETVAGWLYMLEKERYLTPSTISLYWWR